MELAGYREIPVLAVLGWSPGKPGHGGYHSPRFCPSPLCGESQGELSEVGNLPTGDLLVMYTGTYRA